MLIPATAFPDPILNSMKFRVPASSVSHMAAVPLRNSGRDTGRFTNSGAA